MSTVFWKKPGYLARYQNTAKTKITEQTPTPEATALYAAEAAASAQAAEDAAASITGFARKTGEFYENAGAKIARFADRVFIGAAADNPGDSDRTITPTDWLTDLMASTSIGGWPVWGATGAALSRFGTIGYLGASRTSDAVSNQTLLGYLPSSIGLAAWGISDSTENPTNATAYAFYGEAWRQTGVNYQPTFCMELEAVNLGGSASGQTTPYHINTGGGVYGIQLGSGGGQTSGSSVAEAAITFVENPSKWNYGLVFGSDSLSGTDGTDTGYGSAIVMGKNHGIEWRTPETVENVVGIETGAMVRSTVTAAANGSRIEFSDSGLVFGNSSGSALFSIGLNATPTNTLQVQAGTGSAAAGIYVQEGSNGSANLGLYPGTDGELQITSPLTSSGSSLLNNEVPEAWLHININGTDYRIPLFTPAQAGG